MIMIGRRRNGAAPRCRAAAGRSPGPPAAASVAQNRGHRNSSVMITATAMPLTQDLGPQARGLRIPGPGPEEEGVVVTFLRTTV